MQHRQYVGKVFNPHGKKACAAKLSKILLLCIVFIFLSFHIKIADFGNYFDTVPHQKHLNIFVYAPDFSENCGGCTVLHYLVDRINVWFDDTYIRAYLVPFNHSNVATLITNKAYKTPIIPEWIVLEDGYVIYPEIVFGNPLGVAESRIIRWILYFPGVNGGPNAGDYSKQERIVCYSMGVCTDLVVSHTVSFLKLTDYGLDLLQSVSIQAPRNGTVVYHKKRRWRSGQVENIPNISGTLLSNTLTKFDRLQLFSRSERFITTDPATFLSIEAAMAGCPSIVVPMENVSRDEWLQTSYSPGDLKYGIAYGEEDIKHAEQTLPLVVNNLIEQEKKQQRQLRQFVMTLIKS